jgi:hypothetical protein
MATIAVVVDSIVKWEEQYLSLELRLQWKKKNASYFAIV